MDRPVFYGPQDFYIGSIVNIFKHRFRIVGADLYVLKFAEEHANQFPPETLASLREHLGHISGRVDAPSVAVLAVSPSMDPFSWQLFSEIFVFKVIARAFRFFSRSLSFAQTEQKSEGGD